MHRHKPAARRHKIQNRLLLRWLDLRPIRENHQAIEPAQLRRVQIIERIRINHLDPLLRKRRRNGLGEIRGAMMPIIAEKQDARGAGYQQIQARITVGSGGLWGKGFTKGTQGQLRFLPVAHNDFIFSVLSEEQGFAGVLVALGLYLFVILRALEAARLAKDRLGAYLVLGVLASFTFQVIYNVTMSAGLAPVKGLTLPLMSYGGSSMIATLAAFGLILNVRMRRFTN